MGDTPLPAEVRRLIDETLESMDHVEVLFRIARDGQATPERLSRDAHIDRARVTHVLRDLESANLITGVGGTYSVAAGARDRAAVELFAETYNTKPVTLIRAVYARPSPLRSFADAFRLRRED